MRSRIAKVAGSRRNFVIFCNKNGTKSQEPLWKGAGAGSKRYGEQEIKAPWRGGRRGKYGDLSSKRQQLTGRVGGCDKLACLSQGDC